jgi:glycosyltransferase involved in cell wall biosynthesis
MSTNRQPIRRDHEDLLMDADQIRAGARPAASLRTANVALVHDYLNQRGGAERVVLELSKMWPEAPIYTSLYRPESTFSGFQGREVRASPLDRLPVDRGFRSLLPLYPLAFRMLGEIDADVVVASSSGWAHLARARADALHVVYCHNPARWLYTSEYLGSFGLTTTRQRVVRHALRVLRRTDRRAAHRADLYIANSENVRQRIWLAYGIDATVVPPPVDVDRFKPAPRGERILVVSRLLPYKRIDLVVRAANRLGIGLDVVGDGPQLEALREIAGPTVTLHGTIGDDAIVELMSCCRALCVAGEEDFGIVAVEAQAAGKPVIAYGRGGSLENIDDGLTGVFFHEQTEEAVVAAILACEELATSPAVIALRARRFSSAAFRARLNEAIEVGLAARDGYAEADEEDDDLDLAGAPSRVRAAQR